MRNAHVLLSATVLSCSVVRGVSSMMVKLLSVMEKSKFINLWLGTPVENRLRRPKPTSWGVWKENVTNAMHMAWVVGTIPVLLDGYDRTSDVVAVSQLGKAILNNCCKCIRSLWKYCRKIKLLHVKIYLETSNSVYYNKYMYVILLYNKVHMQKIKMKTRYIKIILKAMEMSRYRPRCYVKMLQPL